MTETITREMVINLLKDWQYSKISAGELYDIANELYPPRDKECADWDKDEQCSIALTVLMHLESMELNLCMPEDIPHYTKFLNTDPEDWERGMEEWDAYLGGIDYQARQKILKGIYPYSKILG